MAWQKPPGIRACIIAVLALQNPWIQVAVLIETNTNDDNYHAY